MTDMLAPYPFFEAYVTRSLLYIADDKSIMRDVDHRDVQDLIHSGCVHSMVPDMVAKHLEAKEKGEEDYNTGSDFGEGADPEYGQDEREGMGSETPLPAVDHSGVHHDHDSRQLPAAADRETGPASGPVKASRSRRTDPKPSQSSDWSDEASISKTETFVPDQHDHVIEGENPADGPTR